MKRTLLIAAGTLCTGLGIIGVVVPILPTTPFLLLAAACFMRSSERFYQWLINNRIFGAYVRNYIEGRGMPIRIKIFTIFLLWLTIGLTITFAVQDIAIRIVLICVAIGVTTHVALIKKRKAWKGTPPKGRTTESPGKGEDSHMGV
ncbi:MAG: YbaN family protein [Chloroflexota bacterium]